jgi:UDP-3-O-[3-hydroxymyristoyl] glucosamine N-acyltransferase
MLGWGGVLTMPFKLGELATVAEGTLEGDAGILISGAAGIHEVGAGEITFLEKPSLLPVGESSAAAALIIPETAPACAKPAIRTADPRFAFSKVLRLFASSRPVPVGIHPTAVIGRNVSLGKDVAIHALCFVDDDAVIEDGVVLHPQVYIGAGTRIGAGTVIYPRVTVHHDVTIGANVVIHSGAVIGSDGFGFVQNGGRHHKMPQVGTVQIGDDVEIGANVTIDRATMAVTRIGRGTKIDNLVHIAHNANIGDNCILCGQVGLCGSVTIGDGAKLGGQVGVGEHLTIGPEALIGAQAGVICDVPAKQFYSGYPARPHAEQMRLIAASGKLPDLLKRVRRIERHIGLAASDDNGNNGE